MAAISPGGDHDDSARGPLPAHRLGSVRSAEAAAELAAAGGALVTAVIAQRWNEANRSWLQRRIGAAPFRQAREETTVRVGALLGGVLTYLLATGATEGLHRLRDRNQQRETARGVCQILGAAATAPDGSVPAEASFIVETALMGMGVSAKTRKRLLAEPRPARVSDLGACPLPEPLLSAVAVIAFNAMAEATSPDEAFRKTPTLLRRMGLARPAAETKASEIRDDYNTTYLVLSDLAAQLRPETPERPRQFRPPLAAMTAVGAAVHRHNPNEVDRQVTRQAMVRLLRYGTRATVNAGRPVHPAVLAAVRLVGQFLGEELPARPAPSAIPPEAG
ncbi:MAG TPA: hypothetical protein VGD91_07100 [Trebonia sp.]